MRAYKVDESRRAIKEKKKRVEEIQSNLKGFKSILLIDLRKVPDKLLQSSRKSLREQKGAFLKVSKLAVIKRALEGLGIPESFYEKIEFPVMVVGINESPYSVATYLANNLMDMPAKEGDVAEEDIVVEAGETDLQPGPALSQLKAAGVNVKIERGKIVVAKDSVVVKKGEAVTKEKASVLQLLGIKPFKVGLKIYKAWDGETVFDQEVLLIKVEEIREDIKALYADAFNLSVNISYPTPENAKFLLNKAYSFERALAVNAGFPTEAFIKDLVHKALVQAHALKRVAEK